MKVEKLMEDEVSGGYTTRRLWS